MMDEASMNPRNSYSGRLERIQRIKNAMGCSEENALVIFEAMRYGNMGLGIERIEREFEKGATKKGMRAA